MCVPRGSVIAGSSLNMDRSMMNEQEQLETLRNASVGLLRAKINQILNSLGIGISDTSASLASMAILALLVINLLFALNIGIGLLLGEVFGSLGLGFLALAGFYLLLSLIYLAIKATVEARVKTRVARSVHHTVDNLNTSLNQVEVLRTVTPYREAFISGEPQPYHALSLRRDEAKRQAKQASGDLQVGVQYVRHNYGKIFGYVAQSKIPAIGYVAPFMGLLGGKSAKSKPEAPAQTSKPQAVSYLEERVQSIKPYVPYITMAYNFLSPVVSSFLIGKTQSWLLGKLLGRKKRK